MTTRTEAQTFEAGFRKAQRQIAALAASAVSEHGPENKACLRAIDRLIDRVRFVASEVLGNDWTPEGFGVLADHYHGRLEGLIAARRFAARQAGANLTDERNTEIARLNVLVRASRVAGEGAYRLWL